MRTAIDYLVEQLQKEYKWFPSTQSELIIKAKMMQKVQLADAYMNGGNWDEVPEPRFENYYDSL